MISEKGYAAFTGSVGPDLKTTSKSGYALVVFVGKVRE